MPSEDVLWVNLCYKREKKKKKKWKKNIKKKYKIEALSKKVYDREQNLLTSDRKLMQNG